MTRSIFLLAALTVAAPARLPAFADDAAPGAIISYTAADFAQYAPRTALDMAVRVPGFSIESDSTGERGFGQAAGNVLINGQRVSGKSNTAVDALGRIPARAVERLEILDGATLDIPGLSGQVLNVVAENGAISGAWTWQARVRENLPPYYDYIDASLSGAAGDFDWSVGLESSPGRGANQGREDVYDGTGALTHYREENLTFIADDVTATLGLSWNPASGAVANLNGEYSILQWDEREQSDTFLADGTPDVFRLFGGSEDEIESEVSGDYEFGLGPGRLKIIALNRYEDSPYNTTIRFFDLNDGALIDAVRFRQNVEEGETILRTEYGWSFSEGSDWRVSVEGAFNYLENHSELASGDAMNVFVADPDSLYQVRVEEKRGEAFVTNTRALAPKLSLQTSLGVEQSEISQPDSGRDAQSFTRPKGEIALTFTPREERTYSVSIKREVGQLDFYDFVNSINLSQGNSSAGNPDIVPQQSWLGEFKAETGFGGLGGATLKLYGEAIEDIVDQIPLEGGAEGPGNIDKALRYGFEFDATLKLAPLGLKGVEIDILSEMNKSEVEDPLTGETRRISGDFIHYHQIEMRHDVTGSHWAWGAGYEVYREAPYYRLDQKGEAVNIPGYGYAYLEHKNIYGLTGTFILGNLLDQDDRYRREVYEPRRTGDLALVEDRTRNFGPVATFRLKGAF